MVRKPLVLRMERKFLEVFGVTLKSVAWLNSREEPGSLLQCDVGDTGLLSATIDSYFF